MNRINQRFAELSSAGRKGLIAFCTANFPDKQGFAQLLDELPGAGADLIEVGMPFSDPIADGPTIQRSNKVSLAARTRLVDIFSLTTEWRRTNQHTPLVLMGYYNPVLQFGEDAFIEECRQAGVDGVILVDLPPEEGADFFARAESAGVAVIRLVTPTTGSERMRLLCGGLTRGFVYYVAVTGVTGGKKAEQGKVMAHMAELRRAANLPLAVGFGITGPEEARSMASAGDAIVVGSALIRAIEEGGVQQGLAFIRRLREGLDGA